MTGKIQIVAFALVAAASLPARAFAQASSFDVGGPAHQVFHQVSIMNCCGHFATDTDFSPQARIGVAGPPWPSGVDPAGNAGSASAFASTQFAVAQPSGVSLTILLNGTASPGPYDALRASATAGGILYSFVLDRPNYVELHASVSQHQTAPTGIAGEAVGSFSLRNGYSGAGGEIPGFSFYTLNGDTGFLHAGPVLLPAGEYALVGSGSAQGNAYGTGFFQSFSVAMTLNLSIHEAPTGTPSGTIESADGTVTATSPGGAVENATSGFVIYLGRVFNIGPGSAACLALGDGAHVGQGENSSVAVDDYVYDSSTGAGYGRLRLLSGPMRYLPGLLAAKADPDTNIDLALGTIGVRTGAEFIATILTNPTRGQVYVRAGQVAITPRNTGITTLVNAMATITFDATTVTTSTLDEATYDTIANQIGCNGASPPALAITSSDSATFTIGSPWSFTVTTSGSPSPILSATGTVPAGVTFTAHEDGTATIGGTAAPGTAGSYPLMITARNGVTADATQNFMLQVNGSFQIDRAATLGANVTIGVGSWIKKAAVIGDDVVIGANVVINQNVTISAGVRIGDNTIIDQAVWIGANSIIGANVRIGKNARITPNTTVPDGSVIAAGATVP
jgi:acetyltransferase-like isoleucine patch superfamily enzyme